MTEDQHTSTSSNERKTSIHEIRNQDFVSRLLAATPPYLYSAPVGPNNFFFSDILRSLVQAKTNENTRNLQLQQAAFARKPRKRSWNQHRPYYERKEAEEKIQVSTGSIEKPLELTNKQIFPIASKYSKHLETLKENAVQVNEKVTNNSTTISNQNEQKITDFDMYNNLHTPTKNQQDVNYECTSSTIPEQPTTTSASLPPSADLAIPPPPVWYPSLYPPYGIDPLHFFIDLRVSGHIYDRKKENTNPLNSDIINNTQNENTNSVTDALISKYRHGSAFTVPTPRSDKSSSSAINLSAGTSCISDTIADKQENSNKIFDLSESKENHFASFKNANYVLKHFPKIYSQFANRDAECFEIANLNDNKSEGPDEEEDLDEQKENTGHIDVELIGERCQSANDEDIIHQID